MFNVNKFVRYLYILFTFRLDCALFFIYYYSLLLQIFYFKDEQDFGLRKMYQDHIPTTKFQSLLLAAGSAVTVFQDPSRDGMILFFYSSLIFVVYIYVCCDVLL